MKKKEYFRKFLGLFVIALIVFPIVHHLFEMKAEAKMEWKAQVKFTNYRLPANALQVANDGNGWITFKYRGECFLYKKYSRRINNNADTIIVDAAVTRCNCPR